MTVLLVAGDDLTVTNPTRIQTAIDKRNRHDPKSDEYKTWDKKINIMTQKEMDHYYSVFPNHPKYNDDKT